MKASNPILRTKTKIINVSSVNALNGTKKSKVRVDFPQDHLLHSPNTQSIYIRVLHCEVPNSFYVVHSGNNDFVLDDTIYTIPAGNYNVSNFIVQLISQLPAGYSATFNSITNKITLTHTTTDFTVNSSTATIRNVIGLGETDISSTSLSLTFPYPVNFIPYPRLNFRSDLLKFSNFNNTDKSSDIFLSLQNNAGQNAMINYNNSSGTKFLLTDKTLSNFVISATDDTNLEIDFNNIPFYLTFQLDIEYVELPRLF